MIVDGGFRKIEFHGIDAKVRIFMDNNIQVLSEIL
jgi:hypothetical protein